MKVLRFKLYAYRNRLVPMFVLVIIPWLAVAPWAPWWANLIAMPLLFICVALLFAHVLPTPPMIPRATGEGKLSEAELLRLRANPEQNAQHLLARWALMTRNSKLQLEEVDQHVSEVMDHAESAVVEIGRRFVEVTRKTRRQVELAVGLLARTGDDEAGTGGKVQESLTDYIHASDALLKNLGEQLLELGEQLASLAARQEVVREDSKRIDGALDQLAALTSEIRVSALDSSRRGGTDNRAFVEMTDRVRALGLTADESSRAIRNTLEGIKAQTGSTDSAIRALAKQARDAGRQSNEEVTALTRATLHKTRGGAWRPGRDRRPRRAHPGRHQPDRHRAAVPGHHPAEAATREAAHDFRAGFVLAVDVRGNARVQPQAGRRRSAAGRAFSREPQEIAAGAEGQPGRREAGRPAGREAGRGARARRRRQGRAFLRE